MNQERNPERKCIVTGTVRAKTELIRFVIGPDGTLVPDIDGRLPGRGLWLSAERDVVKTACAKRSFAKAARAKVEVETDLDERIEALLVRKGLEIIGLARRAGQLITGFEKVRSWLKSGNKPGLLLAARDGADDGRRKIRALAPGLPVIDLFDAEELGSALGRDQAVHGVIAEGGLAERLLAETHRLAGFRSAAQKED